MALAEAEDDRDAKGCIKIKNDHIRATVRMSKAFKDYLTKVHHNKDETQRAAMWGHRYDAFDKDKRSNAEPKI